MKNILTILLCLLALNVTSQTLKKTYYDQYAKTMILEEYYVNSAGNGNGSYKKYWKDGNLILVGTYKDGLKEGVWTSYSRNTGKQQVSQTETYKNDILNGPAVYYLKGGVVKEKGSYLDGKRHGMWSLMQSYDSYGFSEDLRASAKFTKAEVNYENGEPKYPDGESKTYFHPSGKVASLLYFKAGLKSGEWKYYFPDGSIRGTETYNDIGKPTLVVYYYPNGKLKSRDDWRSGKMIHEGYKTNGQPDDITYMLREQAEDIAAAELEIDNRNFEKSAQLYRNAKAYSEAANVDVLLKADELYKQGKYHEALVKISSAKKVLDIAPVQNYYNEVYAAYVMWLDEFFNKKAEAFDVKPMNDWLPSMKKVLVSTDYIKFETLTKTTEDQLSKLLELDKKLMFLRDEFNNENYSKSKLGVIAKAKIVIEFYTKEYNQELTFEGMIIKGQKLVDAQTKVLSYSEDEYKSLLKQLKKLETVDDIKKVLKI